MRRLRVELPGRSYPILVGTGLLERSDSLLSSLGYSSRPLIITNSLVLRTHGAALLRSLRRRWENPPVIAIGDGERFKNHTTLLGIYAAMFRAQADRRSWVVAFGGGVVGDIAGYAAATFMRGIPFVSVPTTLLAQVDSAIGGKVGINLRYGKNLVGAFHQPSAVISDIATLATLSDRELASGLYEVIKAGAIRSEPLLAYLERRLDDVLARKPGALERIVLESSRIKAEVVSGDEHEEELRMILNYGHTVGHALEAATAYRRFSHGEAVAWGMLAALAFGKELGLLDPRGCSRLARLIWRVQTLPGLRGISRDRLWNSLSRDKKFRSGNIRMVLLRRLGETEIRSDIDPAHLKRFLSGFLAAPGRHLGAG